METHLGDRFARTAKDIILQDHGPADAHLDRIISPTIFSVRTNRRLFRGMVHITETQGWQRGMQAARERSRWELSDAEVERYLAQSFDFMAGLLAEAEPATRQLDPSGERPLKVAKEVRRTALREFGRREPERLQLTADEHFGLPSLPQPYWSAATRRLAWGEDAPPRPRRLFG